VKGHNLLRAIASLALATIILAAPAAHAHEQNAGNNVAQNIVTHVDTSITGAASAVSLCAANTYRVTAIVRNTGSASMRVGDSTTDNTHGTPIAAGGIATFDVTGAIYVYSQSGTTAGCDEVVRP
jgi:hypothetical protein